MTKITPLMLGIGGDSGTGKSTFVGGIYKIFGPEKITNINLDDYHTFDRAQRKTYGLTALHPAANNMTMEIDGSIHPQTAAGLEQRIWAHLLSPMKLIQDLAPDQLGSFAEGDTSGHSDPLVLVQLLAVYYLLQAREARQNAPQEGLAEMAGG